jgi:hypothetical protein
MRKDRYQLRPSQWCRRHRRASNELSDDNRGDAVLWQADKPHLPLSITQYQT